MTQNLKIIPATSLTPVLKPQPRKILPGSWVADLIALHKTVFVCRGCEDRQYLGRANYRELTRFHGVGMCDGCQDHGPAALWLWEGSRFWQETRVMDRIAEIRNRELQLAGNRRR